MPGEQFIRSAPYKCELVGHIMEEHWWPKNRTTKYRHCVIPGCKFQQEEAATS